MKRFLIRIIKFYRKYISSGLPGHCGFSPSCSQYGLDAIMQHGAIKGSGLTLWRILRCNGFSAGGFDPVPQSLKGDNKWVL